MWFVSAVSNAEPTIAYCDCAPPKLSSTRMLQVAGFAGVPADVDIAFARTKTFVLTGAASE